MPLQLPSLDEIDEEEITITVAKPKKSSSVAPAPSTPSAAAPSTPSKPAAPEHDARFGVVSVPSGATEEPLHRRIDIRYFPYNCYWCGVLYFTGDSFTNQEMRRVAIEKGMKLSEYCLATEGGDGPALPVNSEADVYAHLGLAYQTPAERSNANTK